MTTISTAGLKIMPGMGLYAATKNAVRTIMETLRQESTDGVIRTTSNLSGLRRHRARRLDRRPGASRRNPFSNGQLRPARGCGRGAIALAIEQPHDVEIGDLTIRSTAQG
ncbi:hypothetical protein [Mycobacterium sp. URHB0021]